MKDTVLAVCAVIVAVGAALAVLRKGALTMFRTVRRMGGFLDDWEGRPAGTDGRGGHPGVVARLDGLERRLTAVEAQLNPDGGRTVADAVGRLDRLTGGPGVEAK